MGTIIGKAEEAFNDSAIPACPCIKPSDQVLIPPGAANIAPNTPLSATMDPAERSIPPDRSTKVVPIATIPMIVTCLITLSAFDSVKNAGDKNDRTTHSKTNAI
jgi:hypothetical protein